MTRTFRILLLAGLAGAAGSILPGREFAGLTPPKTGKIPVAIVLTQHANLIDFAGPWEVFGSVRIEGRGRSKGSDEPQDDQFPFDLYIVGDAAAPVDFDAGITMVPRFTCDNAPTPAVIVVGAQQGSPRMKAWLQKAAADPRTKVIMSVCTGAFKLAGAGLLAGKPATTHHGFYDEFSKDFPNVTLRRGVRFVRSDARIFTAGGLTSGIDLALHIVDLYFGADAAQRTADWMEYQGTGWRTKD